MHFATLATTRGCVDQHSQCRMWSTLGKCYTNHKFMLACCEESCNSCGVECTDLFDDCEFWATIGLCHKNRRWMIPNCRKSCIRCRENVADCKARNDIILKTFQN
ncbi:putative tyrosinase-like protein tyr-3 isoform X2 [Gigantopelta aegis]|uniref:putative tyrosinase-like protein tyr-3 isoform X2 n=1 Tax=Gigantopelta aegis TaxID=1735272 RepID=UPI001B88C117|nr:putative tyrosinase-like protein tyr-3 isoform X2 [Gigantopelta aegis]